MTGRIFESLVLPKDEIATSACEDRVLILPHDLAAVFDGATDNTGQRCDGKTAGALAAKTIASALLQS